MGCTIRDKPLRANRKLRSPAESDSDPIERAIISRTAITDSSESLNISEFGFEIRGGGAKRNPNLKSSESGDGGGGRMSFAGEEVGSDGGWGYCTEEQLEGLLLRNLEYLYKEAISKLVALGYEEGVALRAVLKNGHCYGGMDVLTNIVHNALTWLSSECVCSEEEDDEEEEEVGDEEGNGEDGDDEGEVIFVSLKELAEYSLGGMVCLLQQIRPRMSKGDALWCLLMGDLHVGRAAQHVPKKAGGSEEVVGESGNNGCSVASEVGIPPGLCRFHGGWGYGNGKGGVEYHSGGNSYLQYGMGKDVECPKRFDLPPPLKSMLKKNVAAFVAGFQLNSRAGQVQSQLCPSSVSSEDLKIGGGVTNEVCEEHKKEFENGVKQEVVQSILNKFQDMKLDEKLENAGNGQMDEMIASLIHKIKDLERQVEERKGWAREKALQAAKKLTGDLTELKLLRMEREEETMRLKTSKQTLEDSTMKRLSEMESALRKASGQVDRANSAVRRLENENAEIRAEMEASKLSASESVKTCLEVAKREKKILKRLLAWERQRSKFQEEIAAEKKRITDFRQEMIQVEKAQKEAEAKWKQEIKAKDEVLLQLDELRRTKEATEAETKRNHEALRLKIEIDFQRHKDDLQRLEQELSCLRLSANPNSALSTRKPESGKSQGDTVAKLPHELDLMDDSSETEEEYMIRYCIFCLKDEVSVVFLPCAHQLMCASCNGAYEKKGKPVCPSCRTPIEQRICVFGASS